MIPEVKIQPIQKLTPSTPSASVEQKQASEFGLHKAFSKSVASPSKKKVSSKIESAQKLSFWSKILSWFQPPTAKTEVNQTKVESTTTQVKPIPSTPVLEEPTAIPEDLAHVQFAPVTKKSQRSDQLSNQEMTEVLSSMSEKTIEQIMSIVLQAQIDVEKQTVNVEEGIFSKYEDTKQLQEKYLSDIKDVLARDEKVAKILKTANRIALSASFVCGLALAAVTTGIAAPVGVMLYLTTVGPVVAAGLTATTAGSQAYAKRRFNEDKAKHEEFKHQDHYYNDCVERTREYLIATAEADNLFKEKLIQVAQRHQKMSKFVLKRS